LRLVHLSDLHLGFRQYQRLTPAGINQREYDVAGAFKRALDLTISLRPDIVLLAGDIFHAVRPTNPAILFAFQQFARLRRELPDAIIAMAGGNHDIPKTAETGSILRLFSQLGIDVADRTAERFEYPDRDLSILAVPGDRALHATVDLNPIASARHNILLSHLLIDAVAPHFMSAEDRASLAIRKEDLNAARWSYIALGHHHVHYEIAPNAYYAGSIEYTSTNPWGDLIDEQDARLPGKGIVEFDLDTGKKTFHHVKPARRHIDLPYIGAAGLSAAEIDERIRTSLEKVSIDDQIVRLVIRDLPRHIMRELDQKALREFRRRALHFHLDTRRPEILRTHAQGAPGRRPSLAELVREKLQSRMLASDIDRDALVTLAMHYLQQVERNEGVGAATALAEGLD
jgi:exonuclease SbcD